VTNERSKSATGWRAGPWKSSPGKDKVLRNSVFNSIYKLK
jgi:hypothetical protein